MKQKTGDNTDLNIVNPNAAAINIGLTTQIAAVKRDADARRTMIWCDCQTRIKAKRMTRRLAKLEPRFTGCCTST